MKSLKPISLLLTRVSLGLYLIFWGGVKLFVHDTAMAVSNKYYGGIINADFLNYGLGALQVIIGALVVLGLFRLVSYSAQAIIYLVGLLAITPYILDPLGLYLVETAKLTFFPSTTLFFASLILLAFMEDDTISVDYEYR